MKTILIFCAIINGYLAVKEDAEGSWIEQVIEKKVKNFVMMAQKQSDDKITRLEEHIRKQDKYIKALRQEMKILAETFFVKDKNHDNILNTWASFNNTKFQSERNPKVTTEVKRLINSQPVLSTDVAFTAVMSSCIPHPSLGHTFIFDQVKTNTGSGYNKYSGHFMAPQEGIYVFSWTVVADYHSYVRSEIVINGSQFSYIMTDGQEIHDIHTASGLITAYLNHGDDVYIRTHSSLPGVGNVCSGGIYGFTSFSGWKI
ncbi:heavy metal-binding protein HIP-like [Saccostrea echinata]|uniref:heavy metal-binding protein HIP-like n=1 Tax=Saccostrea echinata TaxID=191078 RepID=UPI002A8354B6|nr:heavy metal-binding protein HIP-like [Saccostrea echinata]